jgi:hypothetical protein
LCGTLVLRACVANGAVLIGKRRRGQLVEHSLDLGTNVLAETLGESVESARGALVRRHGMNAQIMRVAVPASQASQAEQLQRLESFDGMDVRPYNRDLREGATSFDGG